MSGTDQVHTLGDAEPASTISLSPSGAVGLDCGPMSGFNNAKIDAEFFPDGGLKSNFLMNIGYGGCRSFIRGFPQSFG